MASTTGNMLLGLFSIWLCIACAYAQNTTDDDSTTVAQPAVSTEPPPFSLKVLKLDSSTSSIKFNWSAPSIYEFQYVVIRSQREDSEALTTSPELSEQEYVLEDLRKDTAYNICITVHQPTASYDGYNTCVQLKTIPTIRSDSLIALFCVIGLLLLCIIAGFVCYKIKARKLEQEEEEEEGESAKLNNAHGNPGSPIEDRDIPFITPPPDELSPEERRQYDAAARA